MKQNFKVSDFLTTFFFKLAECERFLIHRIVEKYRKIFYAYTNNELILRKWILR